MTATVSHAGIPGAASLLQVRALPPSRVLTLGVVLALSLTLACVAIARRQPYLGLGRVQAGRTESPAALPLPDRREVTVIADEFGHSITLRADDLEPEPDNPFHDYPGFNQFLRRQDRLAQILRGNRVHLADSGHRNTVVQPLVRRPLLRLPWLFWYQLLIGLGCWLCGLAIWAFRRDEPVAAYCALSSLGILILTDSAAVYSTRELALPAVTFRTLSAINHFGSLLACGAFVSVLWYYPRRLGPGNPGPWLVGVCLLLWLADVSQHLPLANYGFQLVILAAFVGTFSLAARQWWVTRGDPLERAALHWFLLSWCVGSSIYLILVTVPAIAGFNSGSLQSYAFGGLLLIALGLGLGVARYRLFELETWWFRALAFLLGGFTVMVMDVVLTSLMAFDAPTSLALSLGVSGWIYFPARQWLASRLFACARRARSRDVPTLLRDVLSDEVENAQKLLPEALRRLYAPLSLEPFPQPVDTVAIADNGLSLRVPGVDGFPAWEVRWPDNGHRLFSRDDVEAAAAIRAVVDRVAAYRHAVERGVEQERVRLTRDLHDDVGARLLTLLHRHPDDPGGEIREVLDHLRHTVHGLSAPPLSLAAAADAWRAEAAERCQLAGVALDWQQPEQLPAHVFSPPEQVDLGRILREAISNALRHAQPQRVRVRLLSAAAGHLSVVVENDGVAITATVAADRGLGLRNMRSRIQRLGGQLEFERLPPQARVRWQLPLSRAASPLVQGVPPRAG